MQTNKTTSSFAPGLEVLLAIGNGLRGWSDIGGLGPDYFASARVEAELFAYLTESKTLTAASKAQLALGRSRVVNFFRLFSESTEDGGACFKPATACNREVRTFLKQLKEQADIWTNGSYASLDFSQTERRILMRVVAKSAPVLFYMGFADAIPHSGQVSRLCASMANSLGARHSEVLQAAIVGQLHDPKFHPSMDLAKHNLATHPVNAAALACAILDDEGMKELVLAYFNGNKEKAAHFSGGIVDALSVNDDSRFVQMAVILPFFTKQVSAMFGPDVAQGLGDIMEKRLESDSQGVLPPTLPRHLHGCLSQIRLDSGLRGISGQGWQRIVASLEPPLPLEPVALFHQLISGDKTPLTGAHICQIKKALATTFSDQILKVEIPATALLHHHQDVAPCGLNAAAALVIADPMMLSPHKVAAVYATPLLHRIEQYIKSFDDNIRLLPKPARANGVVWQRAVLLSVLEAADRLHGTTARMAAFKAAHNDADINQEVDDLRALLLDAETWGTFAQCSNSETSGNIKHVLGTLEAAYVTVVTQYRQAIYRGSGNMAKFYPVRGK